MKPCCGYEETHQIDEYGNVFAARGKLTWSTNNSKKYARVQMCSNGNRRTESVHRLVALTYIPNPESKPQVNHIDGVKLNNHISNLEWVTNQENMTHAIESGLFDSAREFLVKLSASDTDEALRLRLEGVGIVELGDRFNISHETIRLRTNSIASPDQLTELKKLERKKASWTKWCSEDKGIFKERSKYVLRRVIDGTKHTLYRGLDIEEARRIKAEYINQHTYLTG